MYNKMGIAKSSPENSRFMCGGVKAKFHLFCAPSAKVWKSKVFEFELNV